MNDKKSLKLFSEFVEQDLNVYMGDGCEMQDRCGACGPPYEIVIANEENS